MRTTTLSGVLMLSVLMLSNCSKKESFKKEASSVKKETTSLAGRLADPCPSGTHPVLSYEFSEFRFKRPITNCQSGFWFCTTDDHWVITCVPNYPRLLAKITGDTAYLWAEVLDSSGATLDVSDAVDGGHTVRLHFPLALKSSADYSATDLATFNVDSESLAF